MIRVFVSGCYDILHAGHVQFFREARALGDHLTVCFASNDVLWLHKQRRSSLPDEHKRALIGALEMVDEVVVGEGHDDGIDFKEHFLRLRPNVLAVTEDDKYGPLKRALCAEVGARYVVMPKTPPQFPPISTTQIVRFIRAPEVAPLRVDFGGGWLDVPRLARAGAFIVNCAIAPTVSLRAWPYERNAGLGGSGAWALLNGKDGIGSELDLGVGWQDPAVIAETGLCVWRSGPRPVLDVKSSGEFLRGRMALYWTGVPHDTPAIVAGARDYEAIARAARRRARPCGAATSPRGRTRCGNRMPCSGPRGWSRCPAIRRQNSRCPVHSPGNTAAAASAATRCICFRIRQHATRRAGARGFGRSSRMWRRGEGMKNAECQLPNAIPPDCGR